MRRKDIALLVGVGLFAAIISFIMANLIFKPHARNASVPTAITLPSTFPDIKNDPAYNSFLNPNALNPAQPVPVGNSKNSSPFNGSQ